MNFICFIAVFSAANSAIYANSRSLMALSREGHAPAILGKTTKSGVPIYAIALTTSFASIAFLGYLYGEGVIFEWLIKLMGLSIILVWMLICFTHLRFRRAYVAQGFKIEDLPYKAFLFPYGCYWAIFACICTILLNPIFAAMDASANGGSPASEFITNFIAVPFFLFLYMVCKWIKKSSMVPLEQVDLRTGNINIDENMVGLWVEGADTGSKKGRMAKMLEFLA